MSITDTERLDFIENEFKLMNNEFLVWKTGSVLDCGYRYCKGKTLREAIDATMRKYYRDNK